MDGPQYFQYDYTPTAPFNAAGGSFIAEAHADFNGNGVGSTFSLSGAIVAGSSELIVAVSPQIAENLVDE
jgi:hypothetical protein